jgi:hypothetical protein
MRERTSLWATVQLDSAALKFPHYKELDLEILDLAAVHVEWDGN